MARNSALRLLSGVRKENESDKAVQACNDYLRLGPGRTLGKLSERYTKTRRNSPPTDSEYTLRAWSAENEWLARASNYDAELEQEKNDRRRKEMENGLALDYERVRKLKRLAAFLEGEIYFEGEGAEIVNDEGGAVSDAHPKVWLADVKQVGSGEKSKRVDVVRFNSALIAEYRAALDDLAKEAGGRKVKTELSGAVATVGMSIDEWRAKQKKQIEQADEAIEIFADEEEIYGEIPIPSEAT